MRWMTNLSGVISNKQGSILIFVMIFVLVAAVTVIPLIRQSVNERQMSSKLSDMIESFYAAESGINDAIWSVNNYNTTTEWIAAGWDTSNANLYVLSGQPLVDSAGTTLASYDVEITNPSGGNPSVATTGYAPTAAGSDKSLTVFLEKSTPAIMAKGAIDIGGSATITGDIEEYADFSFDSIFEDSLSNVRGDVEDTEIVDTPANNYDPVPSPEDTYTDTNMNGIWDTGEPIIDDWNSDGGWDDEVDITWFEWAGNNDYQNPPRAQITADGWTGSSVLVVYGGDLKITGGTFDGLIYVKSKEISVIIDGEVVTKHVGGNLAIAGNAVISGAILVDGSVEDVAGITGSPTISFDLSKIPLDIFNNTDPMPFQRQELTWGEVNK